MMKFPIIFGQSGIFFCYNADKKILLNYCMAMYLGSSIQDEKSLVQYVKDTLDADEKGTLFAQWYASMCRRGIPIEWADMI